MIRIVYRTGEEDLVSPKFLDILLYLNQIQLFERKDGWVVVGVDPLRNPESNSYTGTDQRRHQPTNLPAPIDPQFWPGSSPVYQ